MVVSANLNFSTFQDRFFEIGFSFVGSPDSVPLATFVPFEALRANDHFFFQVSPQKRPSNELFFWEPLHMGSEHGVHRTLP